MAAAGLVERIRGAGRGPALQRALGAVMVLTALAMATDLDVRFQTALANDFPVSSRTRPARSSARAPSRTASPTCAAGRSSTATSTASWLRRARTRLPGSARRPSSPATSAGSTRPPARPLKRLRGRVVLVDFWTYTCINCIRTLPHVKALGRPLPRRTG